MPAEVDLFRKFYTKLNRAREHLSQDNLLACIMNLNEAMKSRSAGRFLKRDLDAMNEDLLVFLQRLSHSRVFKETFGPVSLSTGQEAQWSDFFKQVIFIEQDIVGKMETAQAHLESGQVDQARQVFDGLMEDNPERIELAVDIGDRYMDQSLYQDAREAYGRAAEKDPQAVHVLNRLAMSLRKQGLLQEALDTYKQALKIRPNDEGLYYNTARVVYEMGSTELAMKVLSAALKINPNFEAGQKLMAFIQERLDQGGDGPNPTRF